MKNGSFGSVLSLFSRELLAREREEKRKQKKRSFAEEEQLLLFYSSFGPPSERARER